MKERNPVSLDTLGLSTGLSISLTVCLSLILRGKRCLVFQMTLPAAYGFKRFSKAIPARFVSECEILTPRCIYRAKLCASTIAPISI